MRRLAIALVLLAACSKEAPPPTTTATEPAKAPPAPTVQQAHDLIANAPDLAEHEFTNAALSIPVSGAVMSEPARQQAKQLAAAGWIAIDGSGDIMLTDKSRNDKRFLLRENGILDVVPLAKKELGAVSAVRVSPDGTAVADFSWKWIPNEVGAALTTGLVHDRFSTPHESVATLIWDGSQWSVLKIDSK
jgi:hypothetical protein